MMRPSMHRSLRFCSPFFPAASQLQQQASACRRIVINLSPTLVDISTSRSYSSAESPLPNSNSNNASSKEDNNATSTTNSNDEQFYPVYIHQVSKMVLQFLEASRSDWLKEQGLHRGLRINANGTFVLQFPAQRGFDAGRIWTSYDSSAKQHWLSLYRGKFVGRFLLKDTNLTRQQMLQQQKPSSLSSSNNLVEQHIHAVVDQMIMTVVEQDKNSKNQQQQQPPPALAQPQPSP